MVVLLLYKLQTTQRLKIRNQNISDTLLGCWTNLEISNTEIRVSQWIFFSWFELYSKALFQTQEKFVALLEAALLVGWENHSSIFKASSLKRKLEVKWKLLALTTFYLFI